LLRMKPLAPEHPIAHYPVRRLSRDNMFAMFAFAICKGTLHQSLKSCDPLCNR
jgi:hypothetical protein